MEVFAKDFIMGNFNAADYGLICSSFSYDGEAEEELGMKVTTIEEFIGQNPAPIYLGQKYEDKLRLEITFVKNPCFHNDVLFFTEKETRSILRLITGIKGYQWTKIINDNNDIDDDIWYRAKVINVKYIKINNKVTGILLELECDSQFAWSKETNIKINATANNEFNIYVDSDDLNNYVLPIVTISNLSSGNFTIQNISDNNKITSINNCLSNETIVMNSKFGILTSNDNTHHYILDDFNLNWLKLIPGKNTFVTNENVTVTFNFRSPRKVGVI